MPWASGRSSGLFCSAFSSLLSFPPCPLATLCLFHMNEFSICCLAIVLATRPAARVLWLKHRCNRVCVCVTVLFFHSIILCGCVCVFFERVIVSAFGQNKSTACNGQRGNGVAGSRSITNGQISEWPTG